MLAKFPQDLISCEQNIFNYWNRSIAPCIGGNGRRYSPINCLEWTGPNNRVVTSVVVIFCPTQKSSPGRGFVSCKCPQILLQTLIENLRLVVCLWVVCRTHSQLRTHQLKHVLPELACEKWVIIWNDWIRYSMQVNHHRTEEFCNLTSHVGSWKQTKMGVLRVAVNHYEYCRISLWTRQANNKVKSDVLPYLVGNLCGLQ